MTNANVSGNPNVYLISFGGALAGVSVPLLVLDETDLTGSSEQPTYTITSLLAGGTAAAGTVVSAGAAIELSGGADVSGEQLMVSGAGIAGMGALRGLSGSNTWAGPVTLAGSATIEVDPGNTLNLAGAIGGSSALTKTGTGTLEYTGLNASTLTGVTTVAEGTLILDKQAGIHALDGAITIGNDIEPGLVQTATAQQLNSEATTINSTGELELLSSVAGSITQAAQGITVGGAEGTFTLTFNSQTTTSLAFNAVPATVQTALAAPARSVPPMSRSLGRSAITKWCSREHWPIRPRTRCR